VPGLVPYRPLWTGVGIVSAELMLLVYVSFFVRKRIGVDNWRRLHYATYSMFAGATIHGLMSGTDSHLQWSLSIYVAAVGTVLGATVWRVLAPRPPSARASRSSSSPGNETAARAQA